MPREREGFREMMEQLNQRFPDRDMLNQQDIQAFTGKGRWWMEHHGFKGMKNIPKVKAAKILITVT